MNKYSDNLKVKLDGSMDLTTVVSYDSKDADMRVSDKVMFVVMVDNWNWGEDKLDLILEQHKPDDPPGEGTEVFRVSDIVIPVPGVYYFAIDAKAEDLDLDEGNTHLFVRMSRVGAGLGEDRVTGAVIANTDHITFDQMGHYNEVFDRLHTTPAAGGAPLPG